MFVEDGMPTAMYRRLQRRPRTPPRAANDRPAGEFGASLEEEEEAAEEEEQVGLCNSKKTRPEVRSSVGRSRRRKNDKSGAWVVQTDGAPRFVRAEATATFSRVPQTVANAKRFRNLATQLNPIPLLPVIL